MSGAKIGKNCSIGQGCFIASTVVVGDNCRIQNGVFLFDGVILGDNVFVGPNATFTNVKRPRTFRRGRYEKTVVKDGAAVGANATIVCGVVLGRNSFVGAGSVVTKDVPDNMTAWGVPAKIQNYNWIKRDLSRDAKTGL